jgi:hypothetical protein
MRKAFLGTDPLLRFHWQPMPSGAGGGQARGPVARAPRVLPDQEEPALYGAKATWLLIASKASFARPCVALFWPYHAVPPAFD